MTARRVLFVDREGCLVPSPTPDRLTLLPGVVPNLLKLVGAGYDLVMVTNQPGSDRKEHPFWRTQDHLLEVLGSQGIEFSKVFVCSHPDAEGCESRAGLLVGFLAGNALDTDNSAVIGGHPGDEEFARRLGLPCLLLDANNGWDDVTHQLLDRPRRATVERRTKETDIRVQVNLDRSAPVSIATGIGFFDHMLEQLAKHGDFALELTCRGDLQVDEHHTVEDVALALGAALRKALGDKRGIGRYGFVLPMDEAQARAAVDLSGRPYAVFEADLGREAVGGLPTELVAHFFHSLADSLGAAIHLEVQGDNAHHMIEASFKAVARSLRQAFIRSGSELPTTKGLL